MRQSKTVEDFIEQQRVRIKILQAGEIAADMFIEAGSRDRSLMSVARHETGHYIVSRHFGVMVNKLEIGRFQLPPQPGLPVPVGTLESVGGLCHHQPCNMPMAEILAEPNPDEKQIGECAEILRVFDAPVDLESSVCETFDILKENEHALSVITRALFEKKTLTGEDLERIYGEINFFAAR